jgi:ParB/RepB/Spo0J family partition protein
MATAVRARRVKTPPPATESEQGSLDIHIPPATRDLKIDYIPRSLIHPDPAQPRVDADAELRESIATNGVLQPVTVRRIPDVFASGSFIADGEVDLGLTCKHCGVRWAELAHLGHFLLVDGERRWKGAEGLVDDLPAMIRDDQELEADRLRTQLVANTGKPLTPIEEAKAFKRMLDLQPGLSVADLAEQIGRPRSTVGERLALMQLTGWTDLLESGQLPVSHAVKALLPMRGMPERYQLELRARMLKHRPEGWTFAELSLDVFVRSAEQDAEVFIYPLKKNSGYGKQPSFNTSHHDDECDCGTAKLGRGTYGGTQRTYCVNPDWWRPLHRKGLAAKKQRQATTAESGPTRKGWIRLPENVPVARSMKGVVVLTDEEGHWAVDRDAQIDPRDLTIDETKLVRIPRDPYRDSWKPINVDRVGTTDTDAVKAAQAIMTDRVQAKREKLTEKLQAQLAEHRAAFAVSGPGSQQLLKIVARQRDFGGDILDLAEVLGLDVPAKIRQGNDWDLGGRVAAWIAKMDESDARKLASAFATCAGRDLKLPHVAVTKYANELSSEISKVRCPWYTTAARKDAKAKKAAGSGKRAKAEDAEEEDVEEDEAIFDDVGLTDDMHDEDEGITEVDDDA